MVRGVAWLTIERPEARNALDRAVRDGLTSGFERFNDDDEAKVLVLTGVGEVAFSAGADLKEMARESLEVRPGPDFVPQPGRTVDVAKPTIAAVNGVAYAAGFLLPMSCDLVVAAEHARFAITEVKVGRGSPWAVPLPWLIPPRVAMEILLTGDPISAQPRLRDRLGQPGRRGPRTSTAAAQELGERIASNAPLSVLAAKRTVRLSVGRSTRPTPSTRPNASGRRSTAAPTPRRVRPPSRKSDRRRGLAAAGRHSISKSSPSIHRSHGSRVVGATSSMSGP